MAVADLTQSTLQLVFVDGTDFDTGKPIFKYKSFNNVKTSVTADQLYAVASAIEGLQERALYNILRKDNTEIRES